MKFPEDFEKRKHAVIPGAKQWVLKYKNDVIISVVGGSRLAYGNGINTFEMYDMRQEGPQGYLSIDQINDHIKKYPITLKKIKQ